MYDKYNIQIDGNTATIDLRALIKGGAHPRNDMFQYIKEAEIGTVLEIFTPRYPKPLVKGFEALGLNVIVEEVEPEKIRVTTVKLNEII